MVDGTDVEIAHVIHFATMEVNSELEEHLSWPRLSKQ